MPFIKAKNGNVVEASNSLAKSLVAQGHEGPFESREAARGESGEKPLAKRTVDELKAHADEHDIDLGEATKKADILAAIEAAASDSGQD